MARPKERVKGARPVERRPLSEPGDPAAIERCYTVDPEAWTDEVLAAAVAMQRREREGRLAGKARRKVKERVKAPVAAPVEEPEDDESDDG